MRQIRFTTANSPNSCFGVVLRDHAVPLVVLQSKGGSPPSTWPTADFTLPNFPTLRCRFAEPAGKLLPSRWPVRPPMQKYHM
jgi:hypothetical protein